MGESFEVDPDLVHTLIVELTTIAESAHHDLIELQDALAREGRAWGDDEPGRRFGDTYEPAAKKSLEGYRNLVDNLRGLGKGIADAADTFGNLDDDISQQIRTPVQPGLPSYSPVSIQPNQVWGSGDTPRSSVPPTDFGSSTESGSRTQTSAGGSAPTPDGPPSAYPSSQATGRESFGSPYQQPPNADPLVPAIPRDTLPQNGTDTPAEVGANAALPPNAGNSPQAAPTQPSTAATPKVAATPRPTDSAPPRTSPGTPWSRTSRPPVARPGSSGTPWAGAGSNGRRQGQVFPPSSAGAGPGAAKPTPSSRDKKSRKKKRESAETADAVVTIDAAAQEAARALAARHRLRIAGFDTSSIGTDMVAQMAGAVDDILGKYPFIDLGGIGIAELGDGEISRVARDRADGAASDRPWILLNRALISNPARVAEIVYAAIQSRDSSAGSAERPMYSTIVSDLGRIMEGSAGGQARRLAQRYLITEYQRINGPWGPDDTLARVVGGYRRWRDQLSGRTIVDGRFQPGAALVAAFAEVELCGAGACGPARVLYRLLVEGARGRSVLR